MKRWDSGRYTQEEVAKHFEVSLGMVRKLSAQRKRLGHIGVLWCNCGRPSKIGRAQCEELKAAMKAKPDATLAELAASVGVECTAQAVFYTLRRMRMSYKKKRSLPASATGRKSFEPASSGRGCKGDSIPRGSPSSTKRAPRRT